MPERAEIEAVARALVQEWIKVANAERYTLDHGWQSTGVEPEEYDPDDPPDGMMDQAILDARTAIAELDRVRDARGDDEAGIVEVHLSDCCHWPAMHTAGGDGYPGSPCWTVCEKCGQDCEPVPFARVAARSPQGEDHEGGDGWRTIAVQLADVLRELHPQNPYYREKQAEALGAFDALAGESNEGGNQ